MAKVQVGQVGSTMKEMEASTVKDAVASYGLEGDYVVTVNGKTANMNDTLAEGSFISIGQKVKGGC